MFKKTITLLIICVLIIPYSISYAYEPNGQAWILCHPNSFVCIRRAPRKKAYAIGGASCGTHLMTDSTEKNGFLSVTNLNAEDEDGWISLNYIVFDEPTEVNAMYKVVSDGRVACRKCVDGKIVHWLKNKDTVFVYWTCASWSVTSIGYVKSEFLIPVEVDENI